MVMAKRQALVGSLPFRVGWPHRKLVMERGMRRRYRGFSNSRFCGRGQSGSGEPDPLVLALRSVSRS
ncbi:hypothetical protein GBL_1322 [Geobacillus kaustophilus GBlys]|uniref:Uncharacterized protein n=1 Tax=Geobacillus kaustophilus GBlys TaxID=1337888 RepID=U2X331_GEOKU|nr:hypothetical protein GBL_1322 [Geobacillus kaustophilus GBlys]